MESDNTNIFVLVLLQFDKLCSRSVVVIQPIENCESFKLNRLFKIIN